MSEPFISHADRVRRSRERSLRNRVLGDWRGLIEPLDGEQEERHIGALLAETLASVRKSGNFTKEEILAAWPTIVGDVIARNSRPATVQKKVLTINVLQPTVKYALEGMKDEVLAKLQEKFGADRIKSLRFSNGS